MKIATVIIILFFLIGCSSSTTYDINEDIDKYVGQEKSCARAGGTMIVKRTGTRIRRPIARDRLATASCGKKP